MPRLRLRLLGLRFPFSLHGPGSYPVKGVPELLVVARGKHATEVALDVERVLAQQLFEKGWWGR